MNKHPIKILSLCVIVFFGGVLVGLLFQDKRSPAPRVLVTYADEVNTLKFWSTFVIKQIDSIEKQKLEAVKNDCMMAAIGNANKLIALHKADVSKQKKSEIAAILTKLVGQMKDRPQIFNGKMFVVITAHDIVDQSNNPTKDIGKDDNSGGKVLESIYDYTSNLRSEK